VFALRIDGGLSFAEVASVLGISEGNAKGPLSPRGEAPARRSANGAREGDAMNCEAGGARVDG
jgi:hypothetical protein